MVRFDTSGVVHEEIYFLIIPDMTQGRREDFDDLVYYSECALDEEYALVSLVITASVIRACFGAARCYSAVYIICTGTPSLKLKKKCSGILIKCNQMSLLPQMKYIFNILSVT